MEAYFWQKAFCLTLPQAGRAVCVLEFTAWNLRPVLASLYPVVWIISKMEGMRMESNSDAFLDGILV